MIVGIAYWQTIPSRKLRKGNLTLAYCILSFKTVERRRPNRCNDKTEPKHWLLGDSLLIAKLAAVSRHGGQAEKGR
jgi:hypothetical protein